MRTYKISVDAVRKQPWGEAFLREMDLVIAANVVEYFRRKETLYNRLLDRRVGDFCLPLDPQVKNLELGIISVPPHPEPYLRLDAVQAEIAAHPRGAWALLEIGGNYQAVMSDGFGGLDGERGHQFRNTNIHHGDHSFRALYGTVLQSLVYERRNEIEARIERHTADTASLAVGTTAKDAYLNRKRWSSVKYQGPVEQDGRILHSVLASRKGVKAQEFLLPSSTFISTFGIERSLPDDLIARDGIDRTMSLNERRNMAAIEQWNERARNWPGISIRGTGIDFTIDKDVASRPYYDNDEWSAPAVGIFEVTFAPDSATPVALNVRSVVEAKAPYRP